MIDNEKNISTNLSYTSLMLDHQGGGFVVAPGGSTIDSSLDETATAALPELKKFTLSIYNQQTDADVFTLIFMVNPTDVTIGQTFISGDSYTREGWVSSLWGRGQPTILANGSTAAFYVGGNGLTSLNRRSSYSFRNFISIVGIFKNNGYYFLSGPENKDLFEAVGVNRGRAISVLDLIKISYDGTDYIGSFNSFTIDETAEAPFRFNYNFEFIISGLRGEYVDGHLKMCGPNGCNNVDSIIVQTVGSYDYDETLALDTTQPDILFTPQAARESTAITELGKLTNYSAKFISLPTGANKDAKSLLSFIQNDSSIPIRADLSTPDQVCAKRSAVNNFRDTINADSLDKTIAAYAAATGRSDYLFTNDQTNTMLMLESGYQADGTWVKKDSSCGALGPAQIMPNTYKNIYSKGDNSDFTVYMAKFGYTSDQCLAVKKDPSDLSVYPGLRDPKFNYLVHKYLAIQPGGYTAPKVIQETSDPVARSAAIFANYNGGSRPFTAKNNIAIESAIYAKTGAYILSVNCS